MAAVQSDWYNELMNNKHHWTPVRPLGAIAEIWSQGPCENQSLIPLKRSGTGSHRGRSDLSQSLDSLSHDRGKFEVCAVRPFLRFGRT